MPPFLALLLITAFVVFAFWRRRGEAEGVSPALWIPTLWLMIAGSRMVSQWFNLGATMDGPEGYLEGSPVDRAIFLGLIALGVAVLVKRRLALGALVARNRWLFLLMAFALLSVLWSDFPFVAFKRWVKSVGNAVMVLVILTDPAPLTAFSACFRRSLTVLIPYSVVLVKYYPLLGRAWGRWSGEAFYNGVTTNKNSLGVLCLVMGIFLLWSLLTRPPRISAPGREKGAVLDLVLLGMTVWLLLLADSVTSLLCLIVGGITLFLFLKIRARMSPVFLWSMLLILVLGPILLDQAMGLTASFVEGFGRDSTLTGRTELWQELLSVGTDPALGVGFASFWLGERAAFFWEKYYWHPNQAHNGYLEVYLNLGMVGVTLLGLAILGAYSALVRRFEQDRPWNGLRLTFLVVILIHNFTEATLVRDLNLLWFVFLLMAMEPPGDPGKEAPLA